jgi:hypothetical protein
LPAIDLRARPVLLLHEVLLETHFTLRPRDVDTVACYSSGLQVSQSRLPAVNIELDEFCNLLLYEGGLTGD